MTESHFQYNSKTYKLLLCFEQRNYHLLTSFKQSGRIIQTYSIILQSISQGENDSKSHNYQMRMTQKVMCAHTRKDGINGSSYRILREQR